MQIRDRQKSANDGFMELVVDSTGLPRDYFRCVCPSAVCQAGHGRLAQLQGPGPEYGTS